MCMRFILWNVPTIEYLNGDYTGRSALGMSPFRTD